ncbi:MAG: fibronectin type III domain-containing protein [Candidatus Eisenbacteria bacterium]
MKVRPIAGTRLRLRGGPAGILVLLLAAPAALGADLTLLWTAPAENGAAGGPATAYDLRYSNAPVGGDTLGWWNGAVPVPNEPVPGTPGSPQSLVVSGLDPATTYYFALRSADEEANVSPFSNVFEFATGDTTGGDPGGLVISGVTVDSIGGDSAFVAWSTNRDARGLVRYGPDGGYGSETETETDSTILHGVWIGGLGEGTLVHYQVVSFAGADRDSTADAAFTTADPPPARPAGFDHVDGEGEVTLLWQANQEPDLDGYRVYWEARDRADDGRLLDEDFETSPVGAPPSGWAIETDAGTPASVFFVQSDPGRGRAVRATPNGAGYRARYAPSPSPAWGDVEWRGAFRFSTGAGADVEIRRGGGAAYRIGFAPDGAPRAEKVGGGSLVSLGSLPTSCGPGGWVRFRISAWNRPEGVLLHALFWPEGEAEPLRPTLAVLDTGSLPAASVALRASGTGEVWFDDLAVTALPPSTNEVDRSLFVQWTHGGLSADSSYHYRLEAVDGNGSAGLPAGPLIGYPAGEEGTDVTPPAAIADLAALPGNGFGEARLTWTATGDDSTSGRALSYDLRWSPQPINPEVWPAGTTKLYTGTPLPAGGGETYTFAGLPAGSTVWFALTAQDDGGNESDLSNIVPLDLPADTIAPVLTNIRTENVTDGSAEVAWTTNESSDGEVRYGLTDSYEIGLVGEESGGTSHRVTLSGLAPVTLYHYRVRSTDGAGNASESGDRTFVTAEEAVGVPVISHLNIAAVSDTEAVIEFITDISAVGSIDYGADTTYGETVSESAYGTAHSLRLAPLTAGADYHFRARATGEEGGTAVTEDQTLTTSFEQDPPLFSQIEATEIGPSGVTIRWRTNEGATERVEYGPTGSYGSWSAGDTTYTYDHEERLDGLASSTTFHYRVHGRDRYGNRAFSEDRTFTTAAAGDHRAPLLAGVEADSVWPGGARIVWTSDEPADGQVEYGQDLPYDRATPLDETLAEGHAVTIRGLEPSTTYHFRVLSRDGSGNLAGSGDRTFTTTPPDDLDSPGIYGIVLEGPTASGITVAWRTDRAAYGQVEYGPAPGFGSLSAPETAADTLHSIRIEGLTAGVTFRLRVLAWAEGGPVVLSPDTIFVLDGGGDVDPPGIVAIAVTGVGESSATIEWTTDEPAEGQIEYGSGDGSGYDRATPWDGSLGTAHTARIEGLAPRTTYRFRLFARDGAGNPVYSEEHGFATTGAVDSLPPTVSGLTIADLGDGVRLAWSTDEGAWGHVDYGLDSTLGLETETGPGPGVLHQFDVIGLAAGVPFYFRAAAEDAAGNAGYSEILAHTVGAAPDTTSPVFTGEVVVQPGVRDATILWATEGPCRGTLEYGTDPHDLDHSVSEPDYTLVHRIVVGGLEPETTYHFRLRCVDLSGYETVRSGESFTTERETSAFPPTIVSLTLSNRTPEGLHIAWETDRQAVGQVEFGEGEQMAHATAMSSVFTREHIDRLGGLTPGKAYTYRIRGMSPEGLFFFSAPDTFRTPEDRTGPPPPHMKEASEIDEGIQIAWRPEEGEVAHSLALHRRFLPGGQWKTIWVATGRETTYVDPVAPVDLTGVEKAQYYLEAFDAYGNGTSGDTIDVLILMHAAEGVPLFRLLPNRPNPFNPTTTIPFELPSSPSEPHLVTITVYNVAGERLKVLLDKILTAGTKSQTTWDGTDWRGEPVASGVYYYRFTAGSYSETKRMTLIR